MSLKLLISTAVNVEEAQKIAHEVVAANLAACVNIIPQIQSVYKWENKIQQDSETLLLIKTTQSAVQALKEKIQLIHSYEIPEIIVTDISDGSEKYINWVEKNVKY